MNDFVKKMLGKAKNEEIEVKYENKVHVAQHSYNILIEDPETKRVVVAIGSAEAGDDFSWGFEIKPEDKEKYLSPKV